MEDEETVVAIDRSRIKSGFYNDLDRVVLELDDKSEYHIGVKGRDAAQHVMRAAGVTVDRRAMRVPLASPIGNYDAGAVVGCIGLVVIATMATAAVSAGSLYAPLWIIGALTIIRLLQRREAIIGTDGLLLRRALLGKRFVPFSDITHVEDHRRYIAVHLRDGEKIRMAVRWTDPWSPEVARKDEGWTNGALHYRIDQTVARRSLGGAGISLDQLDRRGRSAQAWLDDLRRVAKAAGGYREPAVMHQSLAAVIGDPGEIPERRVGAALALLEANPKARGRIKAAAGACAEPHLSAALEQAARGQVDDAALAAAGERHRGMAARQRIVIVDEDNADNWDEEWEEESLAIEEQSSLDEAQPAERYHQS